jgi:hypothetical protein
MKIKAPVGERKGGSDLVGLQRGESVNPRILEWMSSDRFIKLPVAGVGSVNWLKWD